MLLGDKGQSKRLKEIVSETTLRTPFLLRAKELFILMAECLPTREAILLTIQKDLHRIIIQSDSLLIINFVNGKIHVLKDIISLVKDGTFINCL